MRLVKKDINLRDGTGTATLIPQEPEDMVPTPSSRSLPRLPH